MTPPIRPEEFDYVAAVDTMDANGYDWGGLFKATQDTDGFGQLAPEQQKHLTDLLQVKIGKLSGVTAEPYARTGQQFGLAQVGNVVKGVIPGFSGRAQVEGAVRGKMAVDEYVAQGLTVEAAEQQARQDVWRAAGQVSRQFAHYLTGGLVDAPKESKNPFVEQSMETVKAWTGIGAVATQVVTGSYLLGLVSKVPLVSGAAANMSAVTRGMVKGGLIDFGINAAWPDGLPKEERLGVSDDIARWLAPESIMDDPTGVAGRLVAGVGGAVEGAILGGALYGFGYGVKLADAKYAFTISTKQMETMRKALEAGGVDVSTMSKQDLWLTYRTRMSEHVQGIDEAVFNGERMSAEQWIAQAFIADPNVTELTPADGRLLWGIFSNNKGGVSIIRGVEDPQAALSKLNQVGINVDMTVIPRRNPGAPAVSAKNAPSGKPPTPPKAVNKARKIVGDEEFNSRLRRSLHHVDGPITGDVLLAHEDAISRQILRDRPGARIAAANQRAVEAERRAMDAERRATTDGLTGLQNQDAWNKAAARINADESVEVIAMDLQNFKAINESAGHTAGDEFLKIVSQIMQVSLTDVKGAQVFRKGGDEFVMVVPTGTGKSVLDQIVKNVGESTIDHGGSKYIIKVRGGVGATFDEADAAEQTLKVTQTTPKFR